MGVNGGHSSPLPPPPNTAAHTTLRNINDRAHHRHILTLVTCRGGGGGRQGRSRVWRTGGKGGLVLDDPIRTRYSPRGRPSRQADLGSYRGEKKKNYHGVKKKEGKSYDSLICGVVSCDVTCKGDALRAASGSRGGRAGGVLGRAGGRAGYWGTDTKTCHPHSEIRGAAIKEVNRSSLETVIHSIVKYGGK